MDDLVRSGNAKKAIGVASASAGAALIVSSVIWWLVDPSHSGSMPSAATTGGFEVTFAHSATRLRVSGTF